MRSRKWWGRVPRGLLLCVGVYGFPSTQVTEVLHMWGVEAQQNPALDMLEINYGGEYRNALL